MLQWNMDICPTKGNRNNYRNNFHLKLLLTPFCISYSTKFPLWQTWQSFTREYQTKIKTSINTVWFALSCTLYARCLPVCWVNKDDVSSQCKQYCFILPSGIWQMCAIQMFFNCLNWNFCKAQINLLQTFLRHNSDL